MRMRTEDQQTLGEFLHVLLHTHVALLRGDLLGQPGGEWMCTRCDDLQTVLSGQLHDGAPQPHQFRSEFSRRLAHGRADLDHRLVRSEEHTSELQSPDHLVCRLLLEKKKET